MKIIVLWVIWVGVAVWGLYGYGGPTLTEIVKRRLGVSTGAAAAVVAFLVALLGLLVIAVSGRHRATSAETSAPGERPPAPPA